MKNKLKRLLRIFPLFIILVSLIVMPVLAAVQSTPLTPVSIATGMTALGSYYGVSPEPYTNTFYAMGRNWLFYLDGITNFRFASAKPGESWRYQTIEAATGLYTVEFSVFYDAANNAVHYARHDIPVAGDHHVVYRMGTPHGDGTITWAAAEQTVSITPADLVTWRTNISVDEDGNPWIVWIDTDGVDPEGIIYIEASSTHDGTWTQVVAVSDTIDIPDYHAWFAQLCPIGSTPGNLMEVIWSCECQDSGVDDGEVALYARRYNTGTGWTGTETIAALGEMTAVLPQLFDSYDIGSSIWVVYTQAATGDIRIRVRSSIQTWATAPASGLVIDGAVVGFAPVLSGYRVNVPGEDLILFLCQDTTALSYMIHEYGDDIDDWSANQHLWTATAPPNLITRHNAAYQYGSPVTLTWQTTEWVGGNPDNDTVYYWWIDGENDTAGYYSGSGATVSRTLLQILMPLILAIGVILTALGLWQGNFKVAFIGILVGIVGFVIVQALVGIL